MGPLDKKKIGIIAGGGVLPMAVADEIDAQGDESFIVAFDGVTAPELYQDREHVLCVLGTVGRAIRALRAADVREIILVGSVGRPNISALSFDISGLRLLHRLRAARASSDNAVFSTIIHFLEERHFMVSGIHAVAPKLLAAEGVHSYVQPDDKAREDIALAMRLSQDIGYADVGQSVVVQHGIVLGIEALEGTDALLRRCAGLRQEGAGGVLVKTCKPNQDQRIDLPTIGVHTVENCHHAGLRGIALEAGHSLIVEYDAVIERVNALGMYLVSQPVDATSWEKS